MTEKFHLFLQLLKAVSFSVVVFYSSGCSDAPIDYRKEMEDRIKSDRQLGRDYAEKFEQQVVILNDIESTDYLRSLVRKLISHADDLSISDSAAGVYLIEDKSHTLRCFGFPGVRLYVSVGILKIIDYESALAALLAFELGRIQARHFVKNLEKIKPQELVQSLSNDAFFDYTSKEGSDPVKYAVKMMYDSGYDPRGLVSYLNLLQNNPMRTPLTSKTLKYLSEATFDEISSYPPLIRPLSKTDGFIKLKRKYFKN